LRELKVVRDASMRVFPISASWLSMLRAVMPGFFMGMSRGAAPQCIRCARDRALRVAIERALPLFSADRAPANITARLAISRLAVCNWEMHGSC
jgi:hypothetical protein